MNPVFALDSSGKTAGVCILSGEGAVLFSKTLNQGLTHSETLLPLAIEGFEHTHTTPADIGLWAVTAGPGSFTGLRIGMALLKGLALPGGAPAVPVSTPHALAAGCGLRGTVVAALDARRGEVYWAAFECFGDEALPRRLTEDAAAPAAAIRNALALFPAPIFFVGDGAEICYTVYDCEPNVVRPTPAPVLENALGAARIALAAAQNDAVPASRLAPSYLRLSQAERERAAKLAAAGR